MCPIYTKTFGGKIWKKLHSVSPDNFFQKNFNEVTLQNIFTAKKFSRVTEKTIPPKNFWTISLQKNNFLVIPNTVVVFSLQINLCQSVFNFERPKRYFWQEMIQKFLEKDEIASHKTSPKC